MPLIINSSSESRYEKSLYRRIQHEFKRRITAGEWPVNSAIPTRRVLCREFKTTQATLDKAINSLINEGLLNAVRGSGTFVGRCPRQPRAYRFGVVLPRARKKKSLEEYWDHNHYFHPLLEGIREAVMGTGTELLYTSLDYAEYETFFREMRLDAMLIIMPSLAELPTLRELHNSGIPYIGVGISSDNPLDTDVPCIDVDNRFGAGLAVDHLVALGHRNIGTINLSISSSNHYDRLEGFKEAVTSAGLRCSPSNFVLNTAYNYYSFEGQIKQWLANAMQTNTLPTALFAADYLMASTTLNVLRDAGLNVPGDISLVAFDDNLSAANSSPRLTTIRQPVAKIGYRAVKRILEVLDSPIHERSKMGSEVLPTALIVRESTAPPRIII